jgi:hypothetical protein
MSKYTDQEIQSFIKRTNEELAVQDPQPVLDDLRIDYKELGNDSYRMNLRGENTPSAFISLKNGFWKYKDFGNGKNGSVVNVVMDTTGKEYKAALNYTLEKLGIKNHLQEALSTKKESYELSQAEREHIKLLKSENIKRESSHQINRVTGTFEVSTNQLAVDYLKARGIEKIPPHLKVIAGEYENKQGELKKVFGVGVRTQGGGADIHFLKKIGDLKSFQIGEKDISFFKNSNSKKVALFESKLDYAAAYQQMPLDDVNVIIANSTTNALKVAEVLKENDFEAPMIFNQNDLAGYKFVAQVAENAHIEHFKSIRYDVMGEYKKDINDLLLEDVRLADRIETRDIDYFKSIAANLENIQKLQNIKPINQNDLAKANETGVLQTRQQER